MFFDTDYFFLRFKEFSVNQTIIHGKRYVNDEEKSIFETILETAKNVLGNKYDYQKHTRLFTTEMEGIVPIGEDATYITRTYSLYNFLFDSSYNSENIEVLD